MRLMTIGVTMLIVGASAVAPIPPARGQGSCEQLWVERNTIFKARGYCFKTPRAISYFGNAGCQYDDEAAVPLTQGERARIAQITQAERVLGCR